MDSNARKNPWGKKPAPKPVQSLSQIQAQERVQQQIDDDILQASLKKVTGLCFVIFFQIC